MPEPRNSTSLVPTAVVGGSGYVAGELLRLLHYHPHLRVQSVVSTTQPGSAVGDAFPHLAGCEAGHLAFESLDRLVERLRSGTLLAVFTATPHGATAPLVDRLIGAGDAHMRIVDLSADFRFRDPGKYESIYGRPHGAPSRLPLFHCAIPEHSAPADTPHACQPGCFATAVSLAAWPFLVEGLVRPEVFASAVTGSSGSGRSPGEKTHHPARRSALHAYSPLSHRHQPEIAHLLSRACGGREPVVELVPHSGPFVRGIHATLRMTLTQPRDTATLVAAAQRVYAAHPFLTCSDRMPTLTEVVGTNRCHLGIAASGATLVVTSVIDNLVKGAAGGAVQWMNRLFGWPDDTGLSLPGLGWY